MTTQVKWGAHTLKKYVLKRLLISVFTLLCVLFILFSLMELMPGSPFNNPELTPEQRAAIEAKYGLDQPYLSRYVNYIGNMLKGDFGVSYNIQQNMPISFLLVKRFPTTIRIGLQAIVFGVLLGLIFGIIAGFNHNKLVDTLTSGFAIIGVSMPAFAFALLLSYFVGFQWKLLPFLYSTKEPFLSSILPSLTLAMSPMASVARYTRSEIIDVLNQNYITLAKTKGVSRIALVVRHVLRNVLTGIITVIAPSVVNVLTGSLVVEKAFSVPGIGGLLITAIQENDYNVTFALSFIYCALYIGVMLLVDILYGLIDPRIRVVKKGE